MSPRPTESNRKRVENALRCFMNDNPHGNSYRYFHAFDLTDKDDDLSAPVIGFYLPRFRDDSPLDGGLIVEEYTKRRGGPSLWLVRGADE